MKKTTLILLAVALSLGMSTATWAKFKATCTVKAIQEQNVILDCGKKVMKLKIDDQVKVSQKTMKKPTQYEGC